VRAPDLDCDEASRAAADLIRGHGGFDDLLTEAGDGFHVSEYGEEDLDEDDPRDWVGMYVRGSVDGSQGIEILLRPSVHPSQEELVKTVLHEVGHGVYDLLDETGRSEWALGRFIKTEYGAEEDFADCFMEAMQGLKPMDEALLMGIASITGQEVDQ
jgi:phosphoribosyl 1,2-cyclic phosphodiesterase